MKTKATGQRTGNRSVLASALVKQARLAWLPLRYRAIAAKQSTTLLKIVQQDALRYLSVQHIGVAHEKKRL
ncbi:MAG: hypothetical protein LDL41_00720 [Coleofasciculus sp. S288]|nr:hypothetical protein [Coleofasciculus sp. S288]